MEGLEDRVPAFAAGMSEVQADSAGIEPVRNTVETCARPLIRSVVPFLSDAGFQNNFQCARAIVRSDLWNSARHVDPKSLPTPDTILATLHAQAIAGEQVPVICDAGTGAAEFNTVGQTNTSIDVYTGPDAEAVRAAAAGKDVEMEG